MAGDRNIGTISVSVVAKTDKLAKGLDTASNKMHVFTAKFGAFGGVIQSQVDRITGFGTELKSLGSGFSSLAASGALTSTVLLATGAAAAIAVVALAGLAAAQAAAIDANAKLADRLGTTYNNLIALQHAAGLAGVESATLSESITKLGVRLFEAQKGAGPAADALKRLGLSAKELAGKDRVEAFNAVATAIAGIKSPAEQAAIAVALFEEGGVKLINLMKGGSAAFEQAAAEMEKFGKTLSSTDTAGVEKMNDAVSKIGTAFSGLGTQALVGLTDVVAGLADFASSTIAVLAKIVGVISRTVGLIAKPFMWLIKQITALMDLLNFAGGEISKGISSWWIFKQIFGEVADEAKPATLAIDDMTKSNQALTDSVKALNTDLQDQVTFFGMTANAAKLAKMARDNLAAAGEDKTANHADALALSQFKDTDTSEMSEEDADKTAKADQQARVDISERIAKRSRDAKIREESLAAAKILDVQLTALEAEKKAREDAAANLKTIMTANMTQYEKFDAAVKRLEADEAAENIQTLDKIKAVNALKDAFAKPFLDSAKTEFQKYKEAIDEVNKTLLTGIDNNGKYAAEAEKIKAKLTKDFMQPVADVLDSPFEKLSERFKELNGQMEELRKTGGDAAVAKLKSKMTKSALGIEDTPAQQLQNKTNDLLDARKKGLINDDEAKRGILSARNGMGSTQLSGADEFGSVAAVSSINNIKAKADDPTLKVNLEQLEALRAIQRELENKQKDKGVPPEERK